MSETPSVMELSGSDRRVISPPPGITLRPYQIPIADEVTAKLLAGESEVLLAGCPGFGKTEVALEIIGRLVASGRVRRALVLAHGTTVLRTNFAERLHLRRPDLAKHIHVAIPHEERSIEGEFDLVVVDEAHEFYGVDGGMVERIIKRTGAKSTLLITGTPSGFIRRGLKPVAFALLDLFREGFAADARVLLVKSAYTVSQDQWNEAWELRQEVVHGQRETDRTMDRVRAVVPGFGQSGSSTIVACRDTDMADQVATWLRETGIAFLVSHERGKDGGKNVGSFKAGKAPVLVVVRRATLGFDMPSLGAFVDLTSSRNPDRIFQMFCRIVRRPATGRCPGKTFVKAMPPVLWGDDLRHFMTGVLQLADRAFFTEWDGGALWRMKVSAEPSTATAGVRSRAVRPVFESGMMVFGDMFKRVERLQGTGRAMQTTLGNVCSTTRELRIEARGKVQSASAWERETGVSSQMILHRLNQGKKGEELFVKPRSAPLIAIENVKRTVIGWARLAGLSPWIIRDRFERGIRGEALLAKKAEPQRFAVDGKLQTLRELSRQYGVPYGTLKLRARAGKRGNDLVSAVASAVERGKLSGESRRRQLKGTGGRICQCGQAEPRLLRIRADGLVHCVGCKAADLRKRPITHGTPSAYTNRRCRCEICRKAFSAYQMARRSGWASSRQESARPGVRRV